jgi:hypothetical protein
VGTVQAFAVFHGKLKPTADELAERDQAYQRLLDAEATPAVALGLRQLARLQHAGRADQQELLESIPAAVAATAPGIARNAVRLIGDVIARNPGLAEDGLTVVLPALMSPDRETQSAVLHLLERHGDTGSGRSQLATMLSRLDPSLRSRAASLCGHVETMSASDAAAVIVPDPEPLPVDHPATQP